MIGVREGDRQYRRGMVLGLTMAEIMLLLIFLLLLLLAAKLLAERKLLIEIRAERDRAVAAQHKAETKLVSLEPIVSELKRKGAQTYDILLEWQKAREHLAETEKRLKQAEVAMEVLEPIRKAHPDMDTAEAKAEAQRLIAEAQEIERQAVEMSPGKDPAEALAHLQEAALVGDQALASGKSPDDLIAGATCQKDLVQCKDNNVDMSRRLALKGGTLPSCWIDAMTGRPQYIFTATLKDGAIYLHDNKVAGREAHQAKLPISPLTFERAFQPAEFVAAGQKLFQWSDSQDPACRFYVRLVDEISNDKNLYKALKEKGVERIFYTLQSN